jgi:RNA polymerase sigma factor (sigma-70 family)
MSIPAAGSLRGYLREILRHGPQDERSDDELLTAYSQRREERAFAALVARYGPLVWAVCRRTLRHTHDAEDAFQAAFLVLARKAGQLHSRGPVSRWLWGVARRTAWDLRKAVLRRQRREQQVPEGQPARCPGHDAVLMAELDEQIEKLPRRYREALILCRLAGSSYAEAATQLGCSVSAVNYRLSRAEQLLRKRLRQRGLALSGALTAALTQLAEASALPARLTHETVRAASAFITGTAGPTRAVFLAQGALQAMGSNHTVLWAATLAALLCLGGAGLGLVAHPAAPGQAAVPPPPDRQVPAAADGKRLDLHGDPLPEGALARIGTLRFRPDQVAGQGDVVFLPDGKTMASVHQTRVVHFWDVASGKERRRFVLQGLKKGKQVRVAPDGNLLAVCGSHGEHPKSGLDRLGVEVWDLTADPPRHRWTHRTEGRIGDLAFSPDGKTLAYAYHDPRMTAPRPPSVVLLDARTGQRRQALDGDRHPSHHKVAFSRDGKLLVESGFVRKEPVVHLWDLATGKRQRTLARCFFAGFAPDGRALATTDLESVTVWDAVTGKPKRRIALEGDFAVMAAFLPDGTLLLGRVRRGQAAHFQFWDPGTGRQCRPGMTIPDPPRFGFREGRERWLAPDTFGGHLSPDGKVLVAARYHLIRAWSVETGKPLEPEGLVGDWIHEVAFSPRGDTLATLCGESGWPPSGVGVQLWNARTGALGPRLKPDLPPDVRITLLSLNYPRDDRLYVVRRSEVRAPPGSVTDVLGWDPRTGKAVELPRGIPEAIGKLSRPRCETLSPDGRLLAVGSDPDIVLYELATGKEVRRLRWAPDFVAHQVFSADGRSLAVLSRLSRAKPIEGAGAWSVGVWDVASGRQRLRSPPRFVPAGPYHRSVALSADGRWLAVYVEERLGGRPTISAVQLWEVASGKAGPRVLTYPEQISMALSPDGRMLAAGHRDGTVQLWEVGSGRELRCFTGHRGEVWSLAFSADGLRLASGGTDRMALIWDVRRAALLKK